MPAKTLLITEARNPKDHRVGVLAIGKERQGRPFAADLILGIVIIGEKLDFRDRQEPVLRHSQTQAEDGLFVQQGVDHPRSAEPARELLGYPVNAALAPDIFAHHRDLAVFEHQVGQRPVDQARHDLRLVHLFHVAAKGCGAFFRCRAVGWRAFPFWRDQAGHNVARIVQPGARTRLLRDPVHPLAGPVVDIERIPG